MSKLFEKYSDLISGLSYRSDDASPIQDLNLWENKQKHLGCFYAPFEHVNQSAKIVLIGITPGRTQMNRALVSASQSLKAKRNVYDAITEVKRQGSFSGSMRPNIVNTLNKLGYQEKLGINCGNIRGQRNIRGQSNIYATSTNQGGRPYINIGVAVLRRMLALNHSAYYAIANTPYVG